MSHNSDYFFTAFNPPLRHHFWHKHIHWSSKDGWKQVIACPSCRLFRLQGDDERIDRHLAFGFMALLLKMDSFALRWHMKGYTKEAVNYPPDMPNFSIHPPEAMLENTPMLHTYSLYERKRS